MGIHGVKEVRFIVYLYVVSFKMWVRDTPPPMKSLQVPEILPGVIHYLFQALLIFTRFLYSRYFWEGEDRKSVALHYE